MSRSGGHRHIALLCCCALAVLGSGARASHAAPASATPERVVYTSPVPGAKYVRPQSGLIVRLDHPLGAAEASRLPGFSVVGSRSGAHAGRTRLADDRRTLLFRPAGEFAWGERVEVQLESGAALDPGVLGSRAGFAFTIAAGPSPAPFASLEENPDPIAAARAPGSWSPLPALVTTSLPPDFPQLTSHVYRPSAPGHLFLTNFPLGVQETPYLMIVDNSGAPVFYRAMPAMCADFKVQPDGRLTYFDSSAQKFFAMDTTYAVVDSFQCGNNYATDVHELRLLPNGHALLLGNDVQIVDMSAMVPGGNPAAQVLGQLIQELDADKNVVFEWRCWDHFQITDATHENLTATNIDFMHANAIDVDTDGNLLLSSRHMDEITKIDRTTGDILWRLGGKNNQFALIGDTQWFSHQHAIRRIENGNITLFDNGNYNVPQVSRAVEYALDETQKTLQLVWQYHNTPDIYGAAMGFVQRLPNGSTLISWGTGKPDIIEVLPDGTKVMDLELATGEVTYRAFRDPWKESQSVADVRTPAAISLSPSRPNPFRDETEMFVNVAPSAAVSFRVVDVQGREVAHALQADRQGPGRYRVRVRLAGAAAGVYFCRIETSLGGETRRLVHLR